MIKMAILILHATYKTGAGKKLGFLKKKFWVFKVF